MPGRERRSTEQDEKLEWWGQKAAYCAYVDEGRDDVGGRGRWIHAFQRSKIIKMKHANHGMCSQKSGARFNIATAGAFLTEPTANGTTSNGLLVASLQRLAKKKPVDAVVEMLS
ncbi:MAG: hypothetical protein M1818_004799 [Claussenomyces sp. TS43310]|nr:MAG: hypothetical protein M1818_004799 [Claussenomyces sp. TS43310]